MRAPARPLHRAARSRRGPGPRRGARAPRGPAASRSWTCARPDGSPAREPEPRAGLRGGHIPGQPEPAVHTSWSRADGTLLPPDALRRRLRGGGRRSRAARRRHLRLGHQRLHAHPRAPPAGPRPGGAVRRLVDRVGRTRRHPRRHRPDDRADPCGPAARRERPRRARLRRAVPAAVRGGRRRSRRCRRSAAAAAGATGGRPASSRIFALTFGGVGVGGHRRGAPLGRRRLAEAARRARRGIPTRPGSGGRTGRRAGSPTHRAREMWFAWAFAAFWNLVSLPGAVLGVRAALRGGESGRADRAAVPGGRARAPGLGRRITLRHRRYGASRFELATLPAVVGHALEGTVRTPAELRPPEGFRVVLSCIRRVTTGSGRTAPPRSTSCGRRSGGPGRAGAACRWRSRSRATPTAERTPARRTTASLWRLEVSARRARRRLRRGLRGAGVPHRRRATRRAPRRSRRSRRGLAVPADYRQPAGSRIQVSTTRRGTEIFFPPGAQSGHGGRAHRVHAIWVGRDRGSPSRSHAADPLSDRVRRVRRLLLVSGARPWLGVSRVTAGDGEVTVANGWLVPAGSARCARREVADVTTRIGIAGRARPRTTTWSIVTTAGKRVAAGRGGARQARGRVAGGHDQQARSAPH